MFDNFNDLAAVAEWSKAVDLSCSLAMKLYWGNPRAFEPRPQQHVSR